MRLLNELYRPWCLRANFFKPSLKLKSKVRVASSLQMRWQDPRTACLRLLDSPQLDERAKRGLQALWDDLNPAELFRRIDSLVPALEAISDRSERQSAQCKIL